MKRGLFLLVLLLIVNYFTVPRIEVPRKTSVKALRVYKGRLTRMPAGGHGATLEANAFGLSETSLLVNSNPVTEAKFTMHYDSHGLIVQADGDGGDTAQRTGMFYYVYHDPEAFERALDLLEISPGVYVRHPYQENFRSDPNRFSRDQQRPIVIAMGEYGMNERLERLFKAHVFRLGKYQNADYIGPVNVGEYIRALKIQALYPVLVFTDLALVWGSLEVAFWGGRNPDEVDDNNHVMSLVQSQRVMPTVTGWLARRIYKGFRPRNLGNEILGEDSPAQGALAWYHRLESKGNPMIAEAYRDAVRNL